MISLHQIETALQRIRKAIHVTPCAHSAALSALAKNSVFLKLENLQMTGSFKERGALNKILSLTKQERDRGLIAASAGNHAQGVSYHATQLGIPAQIWMPLTTPLIKVSATRAYGAEVVLHGNNYDEAYQGALQQCQEAGLTFIHPFDDEEVIAGQGTLGLELLQQLPLLEAVVVPVGGGGLIAGVACALKESNPKIKVIGVQTSRLPSMKLAVEQNGPVTIPASTTLADGIAVRCAGEKTLPIVSKYVDEILTVDEEEIAKAILLLLEREKTVAEGAGAVGLAALIHQKTEMEGKKTAVVISGGNIDVNMISRIIERGLVKDGRLLRLRVRLPDHPGALHGLAGLIASTRANIVETSYNRAYHGVSLGDTMIELTLETRGADHILDLTGHLTTAGYSYDRVL